LSAEGRGPAAVIFLALLFVGAAGEGEGHAGTMAFFGKVINFLILFGGLGALLRKPLRAMLEKKASDIRSALDAARGSRIEAEERRESVRARLEGVAAEVERMKGDAAARGRAEKERIARAAADESVRLKDLAAREIDAQAAAAVRELRAFVAEAATAAVRERLRGRLAPEAQAGLVDRSIERLSRLNEEPDAR
jgi:F-type H+-transporting ATPase subunit b